MTTLTVPTATTAPSVPTVAVRLLEPMPGFDGLLDWTLSPIDPDGVLHALRSGDVPDLRFVLTPAEYFFPGYAPALGDVLLGADDARVYLVLTIGRELVDATANLRAPVVVSAASGVALQVIVDDETLSMRAPILPDAPR